MTTTDLPESRSAFAAPALDTSLILVPVFTALGTAPTANNDSYTVVHDHMLVVDAEEGLLANDTDPEDDPLQVTLLGQPSHGSCTFQVATPYGDGSFNYLPDAGYVGTDTFTYTISDGTSESTGTVTITVTNAAPTGQADQYTIIEDQVLTAGGSGGGGSLPPGGGPLPPGGGPPSGGGPSLLANDADSDNDILRTELVTDVSSGSLVLHDDGSFIYTPDPNFAGTDSFTYRVLDGITNSAPVTVTITVQATGPFDLDGHDSTTETQWMSEPDEAFYGLAASVGQTSTIYTRVYNVPLDMMIATRGVSFDPTKLSINGSTSGYIDLSSSGGNEQLTVTALTSGYGSTLITYTISGLVGGEGFATIVQLRVVPKKAELVQLEFTSDHNVLRENTKDATKSGNRYNDVEFVRANKYNAPMTQSMSLTGVPSKMKVKVTWDWSGIANNETFKLVGTSAEQALTFESATFGVNFGPNGTIPASGVLEVTATNDVGGNIRTIDAEIIWSIVLNPGPNQFVLPMGDSGSHTIHVLFGAPRTQDREPFQATDIRMIYTVGVASQALANARAAVAPAGPTYQRIAFQVVRFQIFNGARNFVSAPIYNPDNGAQMIPKGDAKLAGAWEVPLTWGEEFPGADCITIAAFSWLVLATSGMPGTYGVDAYAPESATGAGRTTAVSVKDRITRTVNGVVQVLQLVTAQGVPNNFEGTVIYTPPPTVQYPTPSTFYFPADTDAKFTNKDHVLTIFNRLAWFRTDTKPWTEIEPLVHEYQRAPDANID